MSTDLTQDNITFGKYKGKTLDDVLKDRNYCEWLLNQEFFQNYDYLYNRVKSYNPKIYFFPEESYSTFTDAKDFIANYNIFNLKNLEDVPVTLTEDYKQCYKFYLEQIQSMKNKIILKLNSENPYDIKAPSRFLKKFESITNLKRDVFKQFLSEYELPNILKILEEIKTTGGIKYSGNKGWKIAKERSENQEQWWLLRLKDAYGEDISCQFKFENCIFDFIHIKNRIIFEAKLNIKDFDEKQYKKYLLTIGHYNMIYLIQKDTIINIPKNTIYTLKNPDIFLLEQSIKNEKDKTKFDEMIAKFEIIQITDIVDTLKSTL
jgi:hypothetical protein